MMVTCLMGMGSLTMDLSIWVAQKMGMPNLLHSAVICFLVIFSVGISTCQDGFSLVLDSLLILDLGDNPDVLAFLMTVIALAALSHLPPDTALCTCIW